MIAFEKIDRGWVWKLERFLDDVYAWHVDHGNVWKVLHNGKWVAVLAVTDLCGLGVICHFNCDPDVDPFVAATAMRSGVRFLQQQYPAVYASLPDERTDMRWLILALGFIPLPETLRWINGRLWCLYILHKSETEKNGK